VSRRAFESGGWIVDLGSPMGQYGAMVAVLIAFDQQLEPGQEPPSP
jgi:hypothetical protein